MDAALPERLGNSLVWCTVSPYCNAKHPGSLAPLPRHTDSPARSPKEAPARMPTATLDNRRTHTMKGREMGLFGKSKKEREAEAVERIYLEALDIPARTAEDFEFVVEAVFPMRGGAVFAGPCLHGACRVGEMAEVVTEDGQIFTCKVSGIDARTDKRRDIHRIVYAPEMAGIALGGIEPERVALGSRIFVHNAHRHS